jgi:hypothetical protein
MKKIISLFFILGSLTAFGQGNDEIVIVGTVDRKVEPAYRITENPMIIDTTISAFIVDYPLLVLMYPTTISIDTIDAAKIKTTEKLQQLYNFYAKAGVGTELMPLGEIYFDSKRSRKFIYGAHAKHLSSYGNLKNYAPAQFDRTKLGLYGGVNENNYTLRGDINYTNRGLHYYGWEIPSDSVSRDSIRQRYQDVGGSFSFASHKKDSANLNFKAGIDYNYFSSLKPEQESISDWRGRENYFAINSSAWYKLNKEVFAADFNIRHNGYKYGMEGDTLSALDTAIIRSNTVVNFKPTISTYLKDNRFKAVIGLDFVIDAADKAKAHIYPVAELKYSMFNDIFIPYVGLKGGLKQQTFKSLTNENEFLLPNLVLRNENTMIDLYGGIKGTLSKRMSFNLSASFARIRDKAFFVTDTTYSVGNKFNLAYDTLSLTTFEGSLSYQLNEKLKVDGIGRFYSYQLNNFAYAWNMPQIQVILRGHYNLFDKFLINLDMNLEQGRKALVYAIEAEDVVLEDNQFIKNLGILVDANLGVEYRYNKRLSAFLQFNNFAAQRYYRWYDYPVQSFQVMGGITARF